MKRGRELLLLALLLGLLTAVITQVGKVEMLTAPLWLVGHGLRTLSLSGTAGNAVAWVLVGICALLPTGYWILRRKNQSNIDWLLPLLSVQIGGLLYFLVNPTLTSYPSNLPLADGFALMYTWALLATAVGYGILRMLRRVDRDATSGRHLPRLLRLTGLVLAGLTGYNHLVLLFIRMQSVQEGNTGDVSFTLTVLAVLALLDFVPSVFAAVTLLWSGDVAQAIMEAPYAQETIALCDKTAKGCNRVAVASVLVSIGCNLIQILLASQLYQTNIDVNLPLLTLLLSSTLYLLCHYVQEAKNLADDNDSII